ncbi:hypothetical protein ACL9RI_22095 [Janthinobacterium sp. Mn2066]|uniref:hypothetical protein n=1 Tax=Janthinobacterium sp. Mn2066 TaxID=3395264 RepID=UPI003BD7490A
MTVTPAARLFISTGRELHSITISTLNIAIRKQLHHIIRQAPTRGRAVFRYWRPSFLRIMLPPEVIPASDFFHFSKGNMMNSNQKGDQGNKQSGSGSRSGNQGGKQGGTHEQHVDAGRQSHKNDGNKQSGTSSNKGGKS